MIVPTYREALNLPELCERPAAVRANYGLVLEVLIMDDDSRDGSREWAQMHAPSWVRLVVRRERRGLALAVADGLALASHPYLVVMDADLSHPPERIPAMLDLLDRGHDFVIGSRYVSGASTDERWHWLRALNSRIATLLARPLTSARDPMAGFLAFRRELVEGGAELDPIGFKIGLELIVKCGVERLGEIPIHFSDRHAGESKLGLKEQLRYLLHLGRLYRYRFGP